MGDNLTDHDYDGIKEYDNPLPNWWLIGFMMTIIFSGFYYLHYEITGNGLNPQEELKIAMEALPKPSNNAESEADLQALISAADGKGSGKEVYVGKCAACHGQNGEGLIGPNLADNFWLHGNGKAADVVAVVRNGVVEKGMPAWSEMLKKDELINVSAYILSLKGSNPANAKPPQGVEVK